MRGAATISRFGDRRTYLSAGKGKNVKKRRGDRPFRINQPGRGDHLRSSMLAG